MGGVGAGDDTGNCCRGKRLERVTEFLVQLVKQSQTAELGVVG